MQEASRGERALHLGSIGLRESPHAPVQSGGWSSEMHGIVSGILGTIGKIKDETLADLGTELSQFFPRSVRGVGPRTTAYTMSEEHGG